MNVEVERTCDLSLTIHRKRGSLYKTSAVSYIRQFGDAASPAGYVDVSAGDAHL